MGEGVVLNLHHDGLYPLEGEAHLHKDSQPTQEVICGFTLNTIESARIFQCWRWHELGGGSGD